MATPASSATSPSPPMPYRTHVPAPQQPQAGPSTDPNEHEQRKKAVQKFLARAEIAMVSSLLARRVDGPTAADVIAHPSHTEGRQRSHSARQTTFGMHSCCLCYRWCRRRPPSETIRHLTHRSHRSPVPCARVSPMRPTRPPTTFPISPCANSRLRARIKARQPRSTVPSPPNARPSAAPAPLAATTTTPRPRDPAPPAQVRGAEGPEIWLLRHPFPLHARTHPRLRSAIPTMAISRPV